MSAPKSKLSILKRDHVTLTSEWEFREDCGLSQVVDVLAHALQKQEMNMQGPTAGNEVYRNLQYLEKLANDPEYASIFERLNTLGSKLYINSTSQISTLKTEVAKYVDKLSGLIRDERDAILAQSGIDSIVGEPRNPVPMTKMNWSSIESVGGIDFVLHKLAEYTNLPTSKITTSTLTYVSAKWPQNLACTPKLADKDIDKLYSAYSKSHPDTSKDRFVSLIKCTTDNFAYRDLVSLVRRTWNSKVYSAAVKELNSLAIELNSIHTLLSRNMESFLSDTIINDYSKNLSNIQMLCLSMAMYVHFCRTNVYQNSIVLDADTINEDVFEEIEDGTTDVTEEDVMKYVRVHHVLKKVVVPNSGVTLKEISTKKQSTNTKLEEHTRKLATKVKSVNGQATAAAMHRVLNEAITHRFTSVDVANVYRGMLPRYLSMVQEEKHSIEDVLYQYFLDTDYKNTKLGKVYDTYKAAVTETVANESNDVDLTAELQHGIEQRIVIDLSVDFLKSLIK